MNKGDAISLLQSGRFQDQPLNGKLVETHISWVILTRKYVFKIKKPMQYSFLNFSTLSKRKYYCAEEVRLNRRLVKDVYLDVLPVRHTNGQWSIGSGNGRIEEYVVWMKRLRTAKEMDRVMKKGKLTRVHIGRLANKIARFHINADLISHPFNLKEARTEFNDIASVSDFVKENIGQLDFDVIKETIQSSNFYLEEHGRLISGRIKKGFQRDVHGDLHARNIFLYRDPIIFDCIEFNDSFRQIDVLKEVAYFCMDLDAFDNHELSRYFMDNYLLVFPCIGNKEEWKLFHYYKCYRANVRAKVNALRAMQANGQVDRQKYLAEVKKYIALMKSYVSLF